VEGRKLSKIEKFEDIRAWKSAREVVNRIYEISQSEKFKRDFSLCDQIKRASISMMSNIAEGFSRQSTKEFIQFLFIAKGSSAEVQSQLYIALDRGYISGEQFREIYNKVEETAKLLSKFITYLKSLNKRGSTQQTQQTQQTKVTQQTKEEEVEHECK